MGRYVFFLNGVNRISYAFLNGALYSVVYRTLSRKYIIIIRVDLFRRVGTPLRAKSRTSRAHAPPTTTTPHPPPYNRFFAFVGGGGRGADNRRPPWEFLLGIFPYNPYR